MSFCQKHKKTGFDLVKFCSQLQSLGLRLILLLLLLLFLNEIHNSQALSLTTERLWDGLCLRSDDVSQ